MERIEPPLTLVTSGAYSIRAQGRLDASWSDQLGGMRIIVSGAGRHSITVLIGRLADQAALLGVLNTLYELGLPLLSVDYNPSG
jgi:hypothetical protein